MAGFTVSSLTDYTKKATDLLREGVLFSDDLGRYSLQEGIKYQEYLNFIDINPYVQAGDCGLSASGYTNLTEKTITVVPYTYRDKYCSLDLKKKAIPQGTGTLKGDMGDLIENTLMAGTIEKIKEDMDQDRWLGTSGQIDGWFENLSGCSGAISLDTYTAVTATQDNIDDIIDDFIDNITDAMYSKGKLTLHTSRAIYNLYKRNRLGDNLYRDQNTSFEGLEMWLFGYEGEISIKAEAGLNGSNYMMLTWDKNLYIGVDEINELAEAKWVFDNVTDYLWFKSSFKFGTEIAFCNEAIHNMY